MVAYTYNPRIWEENCEFEASLDYAERPYLQPKQK